MIVLHRLGHSNEELLLNPDLIFTVEANPDTVISTTLGAKIVVNETPTQVADAVREWRVAIMTEALTRRHTRRERPTRTDRDTDRPPLAAVAPSSRFS